MFRNDDGILIKDFSAGTPYPSTIAVSGLGPSLTKVTLTLDRLTHACMSDVEALLVGPQGQKLLALADAGGCDVAVFTAGGDSTTTFTFDDNAPTRILDCAGDVDPSDPNDLEHFHNDPDGTYKPTDCDFGPGEVDTLPPPAPADPYDSMLSTFVGTNPNGTWSLYVSDKFEGSSGYLRGWSLSITMPEQCADGKDNDGDGKVDFPADRGCSSGADDDETDPASAPSRSTPANPYPPSPSSCPTGTSAGVSCRGSSTGPEVITGTAGADRIVGTSGNDVINCGAGDDMVDGGGGNDVINCGPGNDAIDAGPGNDVVHGGPGNDVVDGGGGNDRLFGGSGNDRISGNSGNDRIKGGSGKDSLSGGAGNDRISGNSGNDRISGGAGTDRLFGGPGADRISGGRGRDELVGGPGKDKTKQ